MKLKDLAEKYGEQEVLCWAERADESLEWVNIKLGKPNPKTVWDLEKGVDNYYYVDETGDVGISTWYDWECDRGRFNIGIAFLTEEEAEKDVERRKVETLLLKHGGRRWFKDDSGTGEKMNWHIFYGFDISVGWGGARQGTIYFDTKEQAQKAIDKIGADRIKEALFEVR